MRQFLARPSSLNERFGTLGSQMTTNSPQPVGRRQPTRNIVIGPVEPTPASDTSPRADEARQRLQQFFDQSQGTSRAVMVIDTVDTTWDAFITNAVAQQYAGFGARVGPTRYVAVLLADSPGSAEELGWSLPQPYGVAIDSWDKDHQGGALELGDLLRLAESRMAIVFSSAKTLSPIQERLQATSWILRESQEQWPVRLGLAPTPRGWKQSDGRTLDQYVTELQQEHARSQANVKEAERELQQAYDRGERPADESFHRFNVSSREQKGLAGRLVDAERVRDELVAHTEQRNEAATKFKYALQILGAQLLASGAPWLLEELGLTERPNKLLESEHPKLSFLRNAAAEYGGARALLSTRNTLERDLSLFPAGTAAEVTAHPPNLRSASRTTAGRMLVL